MTLVIKKLDQKVLRSLKAEAARRGLTLAEVFQEAANLWLSKQQEKPVSTEADRNNEFYEANHAELQRQYKDRFVVIAGGELVGAYHDLNAAGTAIRSLKPRPRHAIVTKIGHDERGIGEWLAGSLEP